MSKPAATFAPLSYTAAAALEVGARIIVNPQWLATCGMSAKAGRPFTITAVQTHSETRGVILEVTDENGAAWTVWSVRGVALYAEPAAAPAKRRAYRGKYPRRIASVGGITGRRGVYLLETNNGEQFELSARDVRRFGLADETPRCGQDIDALPVRAFRRGYSRAMAALYRVGRGSEVNFEPKGVTARDIAAAALVDARRRSDIESRLAAAQAIAFAAANVLTLQLEGGEWATVAGEAIAILQASAARYEAKPAPAKPGTHRATFTLDGARVALEMRITAREHGARSYDLGVIPAGTLEIALSGTMPGRGSGQVQDALRDLYQESPGRSRELETVLDAWESFHLGGMNAGTGRQQAHLMAHAKAARTYAEKCEALRLAGLLTDRGYTYGTGWLYEAMPADDLAATLAAFLALEGADIGEAPDLDSLEELDGDRIDSRDVIANAEIYRAWARVNGIDLSNDPALSSNDYDAAMLETIRAARAVIVLDRDGESYAPDWQHGETMIADSDFEAYAQELAKDIGAINRDAKWPNNCIDWASAAEQLKVDYTAIEFNGVTYWIR